MRYWLKKWKLLVLVTAIVLCPLITCLIDYRLAVHDKPPLFAVRTEMYKDGGTAVYYGLGYKVIDYNQLEGRKDVVFQSLIFKK